MIEAADVADADARGEAGEGSDGGPAAAWRLTKSMGESRASSKARRRWWGQGKGKGWGPRD
jgi:hypothetical protein